MAEKKKTEETNPVKKPLQDLVRVEKNGLKVDARKETLQQWIKKGFKEVKAGE